MDESKRLPGLGDRQPNIGYGAMGEPENVNPAGGTITWKKTMGKNGSVKRIEAGSTSTQGEHSTPTGE